MKHTTQQPPNVVSDNRRDRHDSMGRREEEPEWFNSGPISKSDTIELHGFDKLGPRDRKDSEQGRREEKHEDVFEEEESHEEEKDDKDGKLTPFIPMEFSIKPHTLMSLSRTLDHRILGPKFGPIPNAKKYVFPNHRQKIPNLTKKKCFFLFSIFISYNTNTGHIVTYLQFHRIIEYNHTCFFLSLFS